MASAGLAPILLIGGWTVAARLQPSYNPLTRTISDLAGLGATDRWLMTAALTGVGLCHVVTALGLRAAAPAGRLVLAVGGIATVLVAAFPLPVSGSSTAHAGAAALSFLALAVWPALALRRATGRPEPRRARRASDLPRRVLDLLRRRASDVPRRVLDLLRRWASDVPRRASDLPGRQAGSVFTGSGSGVTSGPAPAAGPEEPGPGPWGLRPVVAAAASVVLLALVGWFAVELSDDGDLIGLTERLAAGAQAVWPLVVVLSVRRR